MIKKYFSLVLFLAIIQTALGQCPPLGGSHPSEGTYGNNSWIAYVYNAATYSNSTFNLSNYRGYYTDAGYGTDGINFDSSSLWGISSNPGTAATFQGTCTVTNELHTVRYMREGFPCNRYQIDLAGASGTPGHDDAVKVFIDGVQVYANTGCCSARINIWTGYLGPNSQVEMIWAENGGESYGRMRFIPQTINILNTSADITVCPGETYDLTVSGGDNYDWSANTTYVTGATNTSTLTLDIPIDAPNSVQVYTVQTTEASTGCVFSKDITVSISTSASPTLSATPSSISYNCYSSATPTVVDLFGATNYTISPMTGVTINNANGSNITLNPSSSTIYTITGTTTCGSSELIFNVTIPEQQGDPNDFGNNAWNVYSYTSGNFETYGGYYSIPSLNFDTRNQWSINASPSSAAGYLGCPIPNDYHSYRIKREGFPCGFYQIDLPAHDDNVQLIVDGVLKFSQTAWYNNTAKPNIWQGYLDEDSTVELTIREQAGGSLAALNFIRLFDPVDSSQKIWTGKVNSNFNNAGNWCENSVPETTDNIYVHPSAPNQLIINVDAEIKDVTVGVGASLSIATGVTFAVDGNIENNGVFSAPAGKLTLSGSSLQTISGKEMNLNELEINNSNGATINLDADELIVINSLLKITSGTFTTDDSVYLACQMGVKTAQIDEIIGDISGAIITEQCYPGRRAFRFITSSVNTTGSIRAHWQENASLWNDNPAPGYGTHITGGGAAISDGFNGFDKSPSGAASMFTFDNSTQMWEEIANTNITTLSAGVPYRILLRGSRSTNIQLNSAPTSDTRLRAKGSISKGPVTFNTLSEITDGYSFIGNPFHAQVDMQAVLSTSTNVSNFIYIWDPNLGTRGAYVNINTATDASSNGSSDANRFLQPYQAVFLRTLADGPAAVTFNESHKAVNQTQTDIFRSNSLDSASLSIQLFTESAHNANATSNDGLRIDFIENENNTIDFNDSFKVNNPDENIAILRENQKLSLESRNFPIVNEVVNLHFSNYKTTNYVLKIEVQNLNQLNTYLYDKFTNEMTLMNPNQSNYYNFSIDSGNELSINDQRFDIVFENIPLNNSNPEKQEFKIYPNPFNEMLVINSNKNIEISNITIHNMLGQKLIENNDILNESNQIVLEKLGFLSSGTYMISIEYNKGEKHTEFILKK